VGVDSSHLLSEDVLLRAVQLDLPKRFPIKGELRVRLARPWLPLKLPAEDFFAECVQLPPGGISSTMAVTVRGVSGGRIIGEWPVVLRAELWQEVWVAFERLERGTVLTPGMIAPQKVDLLKESGPHPVSSETDLTGYELDQAVAAGRPLRKKDLVERSLIRKGQFVDAVASEGGINIRMRALALEGGAAGAVIRVRNLDSNREFVGQVLNETQVQVRF
jgi:flagella basal body P-ring formation protein FlgA